MKKRSRPRFKVGDTVRLAQERKTFQRGYVTRWTRELFNITHRENTTPYVYRVNDQKRERVLGTFYEEEMQKVKDSGLYRIEAILRRKGGRALVRWAGYGAEFDSWIPLTNIQQNYLN